MSLGDAGPNFWAYHQNVDRFPNEGGFLGASTPATLLQFLPEGQRVLRSFSWEHHDNSVNFWNDDLGVTYKSVEYWLGKNYRDLGFALENSTWGADCGYCSMHNSQGAMSMFA